MRLQQYLTEETDYTAINAWELIKRKCKPFLKEWLPIVKRNNEAYWLYRGMKKTGQDYGIKDVRQNRKPMDMPAKPHKLLDDLFLQKFRFRARSQGVFISGDIRQTFAYGETFMIFPVGQYKYVWSDKIRDLSIDIYKHEYQEENSVTYERELRKSPDLKGTPEVMAEIEKMVKARNRDVIWRVVGMYHSDNLGLALKDKKEIMFGCESYVYVPVNWSDELEEVILNEI